MKQVETKNVSMTKIMGRQSFKLGMDDIRKGRPPREDWTIPRGKKTNSISASWSYERGRAFAIFCLSETGHIPDIKDGRKVTNAAIVAYYSARRSGAII